MKKKDNMKENSDIKNAMTLLEIEKNITTLIPDISYAKEKPAVLNPFKSRLKLTMMDKIQVMYIHTLCIIV